jgi:integrase/recombinase XerD
MQKLYDQFIKEKRFLENLSERTLKYYGWIFNRWDDYIGEMPDKQNIKDFVIKVQESGVSVYTANSYIRGMNSFLTWMAENDHCELFRIKKLKEPEKVLKLFTEAHLKALLAYKPKTFAQTRLYAMVCFALDTGSRVNEILTLKRDALDFDNLLATVNGKGSKERVVPISIEVRKILYKFVSAHSFELVFPSRDGDRLSYRTALQQFSDLCEMQGIKGVRTSWHTLRHTFASSYVRDGGNIIYLQKILGHSDISVTKIYVKPLPSDLGLMHRKTSLIKRLR